MKVTCPSPHDIVTAGDGYCPVCGLAVGPDVAASSCCAGCGAAHTGGSFCESCGHRHDPSPRRTSTRRPTRWLAVVAADRRQFDALAGEARGFEFPALPERHVELSSETLRIGHAPNSTDPPLDVDLGGPPPDPGVSRLHAELLRQRDGSWAVRDAGSTNGTFIERHRLVPGVIMPLSAGDRIRLGLWTCITLITD